MGGTTARKGAEPGCGGHAAKRMERWRVAWRGALSPTRRVHSAAGDGRDEEGLTASTPPALVRSRGGGRARRRNQKEAGCGTNSPALGQAPRPPSPAPKRNLCVPSRGSPHPKIGTTGWPRLPDTPPLLCRHHIPTLPPPTHAGIPAPKGTAAPPPHAAHARHAPSPEAAQFQARQAVPAGGATGACQQPPRHSGDRPAAPARRGWRKSWPSNHDLDGVADAAGRLVRRRRRGRDDLTGRGVAATRRPRPAAAAVSRRGGGGCCTARPCQRPKPNPVTAPRGRLWVWQTCPRAGEPAGRCSGRHRGAGRARARHSADVSLTWSSVGVNRHTFLHNAAINVHSSSARQEIASSMHRACIGLHRRPGRKSHRACIEHASGCIVGPAGNRIERMHRAASAIEGGIRWAFLGASEPPSKSIDRSRITADKNPTPRAFLSDRLHFETRPPFHCALCTGSSANDWSSYCTL